jgi:hypothetical protein
MVVTKSGVQLSERIKKAIDDNVITASEFEEIMHLANEDGHIDAHEKVLLRELKNLIADKTVRKVPG